MTRKQAIAYARVAGYHNDTGAFTRLICEQRVNRQVMNEAWHNGKLAKANGVPCGCYECKNEAAANVVVRNPAMLADALANTAELNA